LSKKVHIRAKINGQDTDLLCEPRQSLLEVLRDELRLTGSKEGCNNGNCGACNVMLDGRLVAPAAAEVPRTRGPAMRDLHTWFHRRSKSPARQESEADPRSGSPLVGRQPLPVHGI